MSLWIVVRRTTRSYFDQGRGLIGRGRESRESLAKPKTLEDAKQSALEVDQIVKERSKGNQPEGFLMEEICPEVTGGEFRVAAFPNTDRKCFRCGTTDHLQDNAKWEEG